jgi:pimeloyl-ACP methyl ester carboxylesterase
MPHIDTVSGPVSYLEQGAGPAVVLVHGIQGTAKTWDRVVDALEPGSRLIRPNLRGRGASHIPADAAAYRLQDFADDLYATLDMIGQPAVLVAWSMGVSVTLELLRRYPQVQPRGLVLVSGSPCVGTEARWFKGSNADDVAQEARVRGAALGLTEAAEPHAVAASWHHVKLADYRATLCRIAAPTLIVHGTQDDQCPVGHGRLMMQLIPAARVDEWEGAGHNPMAHDPLRFARTIDAFIGSLNRMVL